MKKVKFKRDYRHEAIGSRNKNVPTNLKGSTKEVTNKHAQFLERIGVATILTGKEEKEAAGRETK
jgi:hypothetical protein